MKVLFSCLSGSWGVMEMSTFTLLKQLLGNNFQVGLLCEKDSQLHIEAGSLCIFIHPLKAGG